MPALCSLDDCSKNSRPYDYFSSRLTQLEAQIKEKSYLLSCYFAKGLASRMGVEPTQFSVHTKFNS